MADGVSPRTLAAAEKLWCSTTRTNARMSQAASILVPQIQQFRSKDGDYRRFMPIAMSSAEHAEDAMTKLGGYPHSSSDAQCLTHFSRCRLVAVGLAATLLCALPANVRAQILVSGNDEKVLWDDAGQIVQLPPGKDTISFIDIADRENPKIVTSLSLENSIFGPPT